MERKRENDSLPPIHQKEYNMRIIAHGPQRFSRSTLESFLAISPFEENAIEKSKKQLQEKTFPRNEVASLLKKYNENIGNDSVSLSNIQKLQDPDSSCVVTGQQLGFMGGPSYTILKGITCLLLAKQT